MFARKKPDVIVTSRGTLAEQLEQLRQARAGRLEQVQSRRHAAAVEAARLSDSLHLARQKMMELEREAIGAEHGLNQEERQLEVQLEAMADPAIGEFLEVLDATFSKERNVIPEPEARAAHRERMVRFHAVRREVLALRIAEVPNLAARLGELAREINLPWQPSLPVA